MWKEGGGRRGLMLWRLTAVPPSGARMPRRKRPALFFFFFFHFLLTGLGRRSLLSLVSVRLGERNRSGSYKQPLSHLFLFSFAPLDYSYRIAYRVCVELSQCMSACVRVALYTWNKKKRSTAVCDTLLTMEEEVGG